MNILCLGQVIVDEIISTEGSIKPEKTVQGTSTYQLGGSAMNTAVVLSNCPTIDAVYMATEVGTSQLGEFVQSKVQEHPVKLAIDSSAEFSTPHIRGIVEPDSDPKYIGENLSFEKYTPDDVSTQVWNTIDHLHMTTIDPKVCQEFVQKAKELGITVSATGTSPYYNTDFSTVLAECDLISLNDEEFAVFMDRNENNNFVIDSNTNTGLVHTCGDSGCEYINGTTTIKSDGFTASSIADTVGAGDTFMAGLIQQWLSEDQTVTQDMLEIANAYGTLAVQQRGAPNQIDTQEVSELVT